LVETAERLGLGGRGSGRVEASGERPPFGGGTERAGADGSAGVAPCPTCGSAGASPSPAVVVLGFVPHADLPGLLANSCGLLMPSRCEGFGLPMLDAFAAGVPVLTSACSSMPEVAGDAAVYCDPEDPESIAAGIGQLLEPERAAALVERGRARLSLFTWERTAEAMCAVYERAVLGVCSANRVAGQAPRPSRRTWPAEVHA
ncbi:MAG: glycosyltransferase, partial [Planctomycetota bacterium]